MSSGELFGLVALRSLGASIGGTIGASIDEVAEKLVGSAGRGARARVEAASPIAFRLSEVRLDERGERAFALLSAAERTSRSVRFAYRDKEGKPSTRTADPYGFILNAGRVYCVAYDHTRRDMRTFAVDSVGDPRVLARTFVRPNGFNLEEYAAASISGVLHADETTEVRVRFAPRVAKAAAAARIVAEREVAQLRRRFGPRSPIASPTSTSWFAGSSAGAPKPKSSRPQPPARASQTSPQKFLQVS